MFEDGLGVRVCTFDHTVGQLVEVLCVNPALTALRPASSSLCANGRPRSRVFVSSPSAAFGVLSA